MNNSASSALACMPSSLSGRAVASRNVNPIVAKAPAKSIPIMAIDTMTPASASPRSLQSSCRLNMMPSRVARNDSGHLLAETIVAMVLLSLLITGTLKVNAAAASARLNRETLENMAEMAGDYLNEARLGDCTNWSGSNTDHYCYAPVSTHSTSAVPPQLTRYGCPDGTRGSGVEFTLERSLPEVRFAMHVVVVDCYDTTYGNGILIPVRIVTVSGNGKTLQRASVGVASL